jgi:hypothetical protein
MGNEIIRAYLLEKGDRFLLSGIEYKVGGITKNKIKFGTDDNYHNSIGKDSRQKVEFIDEGKNKMYPESPIEDAYTIPDKDKTYYQWQAQKPNE